MKDIESRNIGIAGSALYERCRVAVAILWRMTHSKASSP
ncbi:predicted protein [Plenodomus lingam JN3]|uniref:Predicted protein n=1 Tax=Leptosphaeria maculans (strain JN3 / isolate v23.1.3 / race Av1-4-5-6-7-8) TaxID=985895 RepID=E5A1V1_LEPMJ|nr:predicted protein [Plenodomus lingam JN3]CBX97668.1 predicted protein [Plenodomus lingam JN3]